MLRSNGGVDPEKYLRAGCDDSITKSNVDESLLIDAIERWLARR